MGSGDTPDMTDTAADAATRPQPIHYAIVVLVAVSIGVAAACMTSSVPPAVGAALAATVLALLARVLRAAYLYILAATAGLTVFGFLLPSDYLFMEECMLLLFWMFASALYLFGRSAEQGIRWYDPFPLMLSLYFTYAFGGLGVYIARDLWWYNWPADTEVPALALVIGLIALIAGYAAWRIVTIRAPLKQRHATAWGWNRSRLRYALYATLMLGVIGAYFVFDRFRVIPLMAADVEQARIYINRNSPKPFWPLWNLLLQSAPLAYILYRIEGRTDVARLRLLAVSATSLLMLSLYGGRSFLLVPVILTLLIYVHELQPRFSLARAGAFGVAVLCFAMLFIAYRSQRESYDLNRAFRFMIADFFPEVRTFALAVHDLPDLQAGYEGLTTVIVGIVPSGFLSVLGVDKSELWKPIGTRVLEGLDFSGILGLRMSLVGELYFMGHWTTIAVVMGLLGVWLGYLDHRLHRGRAAIDRYPYIVAGLLTMLLIPYGTLYFVTVVWVLVPAFAISWFCRTPRASRSSASAAPPPAEPA